MLIYVGHEREPRDVSEADIRALQAALWAGTFSTEQRDLLDACLSHLAKAASPTLTALQCKDLTTLLVLAAKWNGQFARVVQSD